MTSEDARGGNLTDMMNNRFDEMEAFYNVLDSIINTVQHGASSVSRLEYFSTTVGQFFVQIVDRACTSHCRLQLSYEYDSQESNIVIHQIMSNAFENCVCANNDAERSTLSVPLNLPNPKRLGPHFIIYKIVLNCQLKIPRCITSFHYL